MTVFTLPQAADYLECTPKTLAGWLKSGVNIPHKRIGNGPRARYRFIKEKLDEYLLQEIPDVDPRDQRKRVAVKSVQPVPHADFREVAH